jgi:hypothetical protein
MSSFQTPNYIKMLAKRWQKMPMRPRNRYDTSKDQITAFQFFSKNFRGFNLQKHFCENFLLNAQKIVFEGCTVKHY